MKKDSQITAGGALFGKLKALGVDYVFANSGTDFPPIIEGLIEARENNVDLPAALTIAHEHVAVGMAHGYTQITGKPQAVMLHTNVGLSNGATGLINAACDQVPMIVMSGRTPVTEGGRFGARTVPIGWGQEMFDQTALVREACKWDYELRFPEQVAEVLDRGWAIANSTPKAPVYLNLPREVLCEPCPVEGLDQPSRMSPATSAPTADALQQAAELLAAAENPLIIAQRGAGSPQAFEALAAFVEDWALPLSHYWANQIAIPMTSPCHVGWMPGDLLTNADVVLVLDALAPWWPDMSAPAEDAKIIQLGPDPLFARSTPIRNFRSDVTLPGNTSDTILALIEAVNQQNRDEDKITSRRQHIADISARERLRIEDKANSGGDGPMSKDWVSHCLGQAIKGRKARIFSELGGPLPPLQLENHQSYFQEPHSGGLGWGVPAAMGAQLADPDHLVFATIGDGSYMFANPTVCHQVCEVLKLPIIILVLNNEEWGAVRHSVAGLYKGGRAAKSNDVPLTSLRPSPDFALTAQASRAHGETVSNKHDLPAALESAIDIATREKRHVLLNIAVERV
ncbi:MAG: thiamine pyrophosphate-requiring protein [Rhizobiaceae bacterium]